MVEGAFAAGARENDAATDLHHVGDAGEEGNAGVEGDERVWLVGDGVDGLSGEFDIEQESEINEKSRAHERDVHGAALAIIEPGDNDEADAEGNEFDHACRSIFRRALSWPANRSW